MHAPKHGNTICWCLKTPSAEHSMYGRQGYKLPPHVATSLKGSSFKHLYSLSNFPKKHESNSLFYNNITKLKVNLLSLMNCTVHECWLNYVYFIFFFLYFLLDVWHFLSFNIIYLLVDNKNSLYSVSWGKNVEKATLNSCPLHQEQYPH